MQFYTYLHCKPNGDPFYVGKGHGQRSRNFTCGRNQHYRRVIEKYGRGNIGVYVFPCASEQEAFADEVQQIAQLRSDGIRLVNICDGGQGPVGRKASEGTRARISAAQVGRKWSAEAIAKRTATNTGAKRSPEACARIAESLRGKVLSAEHRAKISDSVRSMSDETRLKMSLAKAGRTLSHETKSRMALAQQLRRRLEAVQ